METNNIIRNYNWDNISGMVTWIKPGDIQYQYLQKEVIDRIFPILRAEDKKLLLDSLVRIINFICIKFGFWKNNLKNENILWEQLTQNKLLDFRAVVAIMLPFIDDNETDDNKHRLENLEDIYLKLDEKGMPLYNNSQFNRCIRHGTGNNITIFKRPFIKEYFLDHLELLLMSIETAANKLYINWVDVLPVRMDEYKNTNLYSDTVAKIVGKIVTNTDGSMETVRDGKVTGVVMINNYIDPNPGISYQDFYNVMANHLYHEIKNKKWLIFDIDISGKLISYITYLETKFNLKIIWKGLFWSQLTQNETNTFVYQWNNFLSSINIYDNTILNSFYFFFSKYHKNSQELISEKKLILSPDLTDEEEDNEENIKITPEKTKNAKTGLANVPIEEIYLFFYDQLSAFKKSWYYYLTQIKKEPYLTTDKINSDESGNTENIIYITPKNIYNYCKSMVNYIDKKTKKYTQIPQLWYSLKPELVQMVLIRMLDIEHKENDWSKANWFNINFYIGRFYPFISKNDLPKMNELMHKLIRTKIVDIVFESLIYHGLLSDFHPNKKITDNIIIESSGSTDDKSKRQYQHKEMTVQYFTGANQKRYKENAYYFVTGETYGQLSPFKSKNYSSSQNAKIGSSNFTKDYFEVLTSEQSWPFFYAMNWVSQINFFHHYMNNRIMYVTGATGVGKSTQVPKLLMYSLKMLDYNSNGKIICTQPRVSPTVGNAKNISREMGVPINEYNEQYDKDIFTSNYYVQYKHQTEEHTENTGSFLRIVTDGTLYEEMKRSPFMTRSVPDTTIVDSNNKPVEWAQTYLPGNKYDIIIVDEAHEHNANMDMILTLARDVTYINNSIKLVIVSATIKDDEPIYRRYYRKINDNRTYPLSAFIENQELDRANMDRRIHISPPGRTTQYVIKDNYLPKSEADLINETNFVDYGIRQTIKVANTTTTGDILLFLSGQADIQKAVKEINAQTPANIIALGFYSELSDETKNFISEIHQTLSTYTRFKDDVFLDENDITRKVPAGTYNRAVIIATNIAEASITLKNLRYVVDTGYAKTVVYDALEGISKTLVTPISGSSSEQRRGRVGRVASGEVFYMYDREKIANNKTAYKIADANIKDIIVPLLESDPKDSFIIVPKNDINNIHNLQKLKEKKESGGSDSKYLIYEILLNPHPYLDIIQNQYMYIPDKTNINEYYLYYGKSDGLDYDIKTLRTNFRKYLVANHDDYYFQEYSSDPNTEFFSRGYTGYYNTILEDQSLSFYIIHPDENIITRNMYTGKMESLRCNPSVSYSYYYYLLKANDIIVSNDDIAKCHFGNINFSEFDLPKYSLAIDDAKLQLLAITLPPYSVNVKLKYTGSTDSMIQKYFQNYYQSESIQSINALATTIKSKILTNIDEIKLVSSLKILNDTNNLLWYSYSIPYGIEKDTLALIILINTVPDIGQWIGKVKSRQDIEKFFKTHLTEKGDIYFLWKLWNSVKSIMKKYDLFKETEVNIGLETQFKNYKQLYQKTIKNYRQNNPILPYNEFVLLNKMFKSGKLNTDDEFFNYIKEITIDFTDKIKKTDAYAHINIIANDNRIDPEKLQIFVVEYLNNLFTLNKKIWMYQYEITNGKKNETDVIEWAHKKLSLPGIITSPYSTEPLWDRMLETYIRAFSTNVMKNQVDYYLRINKGIRMDPMYWSKKLILEKTFLKYKTDYLVYHNDENRANTIGAVFLTPVKLEWVIQLNPVYYYYFFYSKNNILYFADDNENVRKAINIISTNKHLFSLSSLIAYLDQIGNPTISEILRKEIYKSGLTA